MHSKIYYLKKRRQYIPDDLRLIIVAESPPDSGKYFYDESGKTSEPLFSALMNSLHILEIVDKKAGLDEFKDRGYLLVDAIYKPVNKLTNKEREDKILNNFLALKKDLLSITPDKYVPLLLIKANVCRLLEARLCAHGFKTLNKGEVLPFPSNSHQKEFHNKVTLLLESFAK